MSSYQYPVLIWRDASDCFTAALIGDEGSTAANAPTKEEAMQQIKELLEWRGEHQPWELSPVIEDATLVEIKVEVRPEYRNKTTIIPCPDTLWLRMPCVTAKQANGLRLCIIPHLEVQFNYQDAAALASLVAHYVKDALSGLTPAQLAACQPPRGCHLETVAVTIPIDRSRRVAPADRPELRVLFKVADPLLQDLGRKKNTSAAYGREAMTQQLARKLGVENANVLLVGASGVGKSTLLLDATHQMSRWERTQSGEPSRGDHVASDNQLRGFRYWRGSGARLIAGMEYLGQWEERCETFLAQLRAIDGIFYAENLLELLQVGGEGPTSSVASFLLPYLQRGELRMATEATPEEVDACRRLLPGLLDSFHIVPVPEFDNAAATQVLERIASAHAASAQLEVNACVAPMVHRLFKRFQPYTAFPGAAAHFVRQLVELSPSNKVRPETVGSEEVITQFVKLTGLPEIFLRDELLLPIDKVRQSLTEQIIGQPDAVAAASRLLVSIKTGLTDPARPLGVLLFCGPTGVGKTALVKSLADFCFGGHGAKNRLVRLDMSEYAGWGAAQRFLQNPQGLPASWIESVRRQPFCVVLFDEIEKAAPDVFDVMLGLLDEGRLTDRFGRVTWFRSAIVIMTSNLGAGAKSPAGFGSSDGPTHDTEASKFFRPEFFNRLDSVITFRSLGIEDVESIARKELSAIATREGLETSKIKITFSDDLVSFIARESYDHRFGARPLQRMIETHVVVPLARWRVANPRARNRSLHLALDEHAAVMVREISTSP